MDHAYSAKDLFQLLDLVKDELDQNENFRLTNNTVKQNCEWNQANKDDKKIYFVVKPSQA
jgi:hypothetical protein